MSRRSGLRRLPRDHAAIGSCLAVLGAAGCGAPRLPPATGPADAVLLLASSESTRLLDPIAFVLESPDPGLVPAEPLFRTARQSRAVSPRDKSVVIVARSDTLEPLLAAVRSMLPAAETARLDTGGVAWCRLRDVWAREQDVSLIAGPAGQLDSFVVHTAVALRQHLETRALARALAAVGAETTTATARTLRAQHEFGLAVPPQYRVVERPETDAVEMICDRPTRSVTVFWRDDSAATSDPAPVLLAWQRDTLARLHGDGLVDATCQFVRATEPAARWVLRGAWENRSEVAGGPFVTHFVYDASRQRLYGVQAQLFAPGERKRPLLIELEALLWTFRLESTR